MKLNVSLIFAVFIFFTSFQVIRCDCSADDVTKVESCYETYMSTLNITNISFYNYLNTISNFLQKWQDVSTFCFHIFDALQTCVEPYKDCMNTKDFTNVQTFGGKDAGNYIGNYYEYDYMCGAGYQLYYKFFICSQKSGIKKACTEYDLDCDGQRQRIKCFTDYAKNNCDQDSSTFVNTSVYIDLCYSRPTCCQNVVVATTTPGNGSTGLVFGFGIFVLMQAIVHLAGKMMR